jgi:hypothetical protein
VNRPSGGRERPIADALLLRSTAPHGPLARLFVEPAGIVALVGTRVPLNLWASDEWYNPVPLEGCRLDVTTATLDGPRPSLRGDELAVGDAAGTAPVKLTATNRDGATTAPAELTLRVVGSPARLEADPAQAVLAAGDNVTLTIRAYTEDGAALALPARFVEWEVKGEGVRALGDGVFRADTAGAAVEAVASVGRTRLAIPLAVAVQWPLEGFEGGPEPSASRVPDTDSVSARAEVFSGDAPEGARRCRLTFDLGAPKDTRAAYVLLNRPVGNARRLSLVARLSSSDPAWFRAAVVDATGRRETVSFAEAMSSGNEWKRYEAVLPAGLQAPVTWQSVYVVAADGKTGRGALEVDDLQVVGVGR